MRFFVMVLGAFALLANAAGAQDTTTSVYAGIDPRTGQPEQTPAPCSGAPANWQLVKQEDGTCYWLVPFPTPLDADIVPLAQMPGIEANGRRCTPDPFDPQKAICYRSILSVPGGPAPDHPTEPPPAPQTPMSGGLTQLAAEIVRRPCGANASTETATHDQIESQLAATRTSVIAQAQSAEGGRAPSSQRAIVQDVEEVNALLIAENGNARRCGRVVVNAPYRFQAQTPKLDTGNLPGSPVELQPQRAKSDNDAYKKPVKDYARWYLYKDRHGMYWRADKTYTDSLGERFRLDVNDITYSVSGRLTRMAGMYVSVESSGNHRYQPFKPLGTTPP
jgi:hypothetical protein